MVECALRNLLVVGFYIALERRLHPAPGCPGRRIQSRFVRRSGSPGRSGASPRRSGNPGCAPGDQSAGSAGLRRCRHSG